MKYIIKEGSYVNAQVERSSGSTSYSYNLMILNDKGESVEPEEFLSKVVITEKFIKENNLLKDRKNFKDPIDPSKYHVKFKIAGEINV